MLKTLFFITLFGIVLSSRFISTKNSPLTSNLPQWGILVTTTKTVLVPRGVMLKAVNAKLNKTFCIRRIQPNGP